MGKFDRGGKRSGKSFGRKFNDNRSFGKDRNFGSREKDKRMHIATCSECGETCELPFVPTGDRPVYCSSCFDKQGNNSSKFDKFTSNRRDKFRFEDKRSNYGTKDNSELVSKISELVVKLDKLINVLTPKEKEVKPVVKSVPTKPKVKKVSKLTDKKTKTTTKVKNKAKTTKKKVASKKK